MEKQKPGIFLKILIPLALSMLTFVILLVASGLFYSGIVLPLYFGWAMILVSIVAGILASKLVFGENFNYAWTGISAVSAFALMVSAPGLVRATQGIPILGSLIAPKGMVYSLSDAPIAPASGGTPFNTIMSAVGPWASITILLVILLIAAVAPRLDSRP